MPIFLFLNKKLVKCLCTQLGDSARAKNSDLWKQSLFLQIRKAPDEFMIWVRNEDVVAIACSLRDPLKDVGCRFITATVKQYFDTTDSKQAAICGIGLLIENVSELKIHFN